MLTQVIHLLEQFVVLILHFREESIIQRGTIGFALNEEGFEVMAQVADIHQARQTRAAFKGVQQPLHFIQVIVIITLTQPGIDGVIDALGQLFRLFQEDFQNFGVGFIAPAAKGREGFCVFLLVQFYLERFCYRFGRGLRHGLFGNRRFGSFAFQSAMGEIIDLGNQIIRRLRLLAALNFFEHHHQPIVALMQQFKQRRCGGKQVFA